MVSKPLPLPRFFGSDSLSKKLETLAFGGYVTEERHKEPPDPVMEISTPKQGWKPPPSRTTAPATTSPGSIHRPRMEPPRFTGMDASNWIIKIQRYFNHSYTPESDRLYLVSLLFDPPAYDWAIYWKENNTGKSWEDFLIAVKHRFDPNFDEDYASNKTAIEPPDSPAFPSDTSGWRLPPSLTQPLTGVVPMALPRPRFDAPRFDGEKVVEWIHDIQFYYNHYYTPLSDRLYLTKYLFDHPASTWMEHWKDSNVEKGWDDFLLAVKQRFELDDGYEGHVQKPHTSISDFPTSSKARSPAASSAASAACDEKEFVAEILTEESSNSVTNEIGSEYNGLVSTPFSTINNPIVPHHSSVEVSGSVFDDEESISNSFTFVYTTICDENFGPNDTDDDEAGDNVVKIAIDCEQPMKENRWC